eukprot:scaffold1202_cov61-Phaeocystis_antarctica.AAC.5
MRTQPWCARVRRCRPSGLSSGSWDRCSLFCQGSHFGVGIFCSPFAVHLASFVVTPLRRLSRPSGRHSPLGGSRDSLGGSVLFGEFGTGHKLGEVQVGVQERLKVGLRVAPKLFEVTLVLDVEHLPDLGLGFEVHVLLVLFVEDAGVLRLLVHDRADVSEAVRDVRGTRCLQFLDGTPRHRLQLHEPNPVLEERELREVFVCDLGHHDLQEVADVSEHARPRDDVAAVDEIGRRRVQVDDQLGRGLGFVQAHDRRRRSERAGEAVDLAVELVPGRACLLELGARDEVRDVRDASPERVPGEEDALHAVLHDEVHHRILVPAEGVLDQVDERAVRVDLLGLARPARGCQQRARACEEIGA